MYIFTATLTEDLLGVTIDVQAARGSGRKQQLLACETWLVSVPAGVDEARHAEIASILDNEVSNLAHYLRRVFPGESSQKASG